MTFVSGQTLTAAELNQLVPPNGPLLGGTGTTFSIVNLGSGLAITSTTLEPNWQADLITHLGSGVAASGGTLATNWNGGTVNALGSGLSLVGGTLTASGSGGSVTEVDTGALLTGGPITATGTIAIAPTAGSTLLGNASTLTATPAAVPIGNGLAFNFGTLEATGATSNVWFYKANTSITSGTPPSGSLYWNNATQTSATVVALSHITTDGIDVDLFIDQIAAGNTLVLQLANSSPDYQTWVCSGPITVHANSYVEVPVTLTGSGGVGTTGFANNAKLFVALIATSAAGAAGGVLSGTYPNPGFASIAAGQFLANSGSVSAAPAATPLGAGLAFSGGSLVANYQAGTLASFGTGLSLVGTALTPAVAAVGNGIAINSGTISIDNSQTLTGTVAGTLTIAPASGIDNVLVNMPTASGTVTLAASPAYPFQKTLLNIKQGSTPQSVALNSGFVFAVSGGPTSYTATPTASARDVLGLYSPDGTHWVVDGILQGITI